MIVKTFAAFAMYLVPFIALFFIPSSGLLIAYGLWTVIGLGHAFIGTSVMHDSLHGSYSNRPLTNTLIGWSTWLIGVNGDNWKVQHNLLHHTYPNVDHVDEDIEPKFLFRFSPNQPRRWFHRYQHVYAILFYSISTLQWVTLKDYIKAYKYLREGLIKPGPAFRRLLMEISMGKVIYFGLFLVLPIIALPFSIGHVLTMFLVMHLTSGILLSFIFQCAHVMPSSQFVKQESDVINENRLVHQLNTTTNFGMKSRILFWFSGGLNHQIEHHLFTDICHIHYRKISKIVQSTAKEFEIPYHNQSTLGLAIFNHLKMLKNLGAGVY